MIDLSCIEGSQIQQILDETSEDNIAEVEHALRKISFDDPKSRQRILKSLLVSLSHGPQKNVGARTRLFHHLLVPLLDLPSSASIICDLIEIVSSPTYEYFANLLLKINLIPIHRLLFGISLSNHPIKEKAVIGVQIVRDAASACADKDIQSLPMPFQHTLMQIRSSFGLAVDALPGDSSPLIAQLFTDKTMDVATQFFNQSSVLPGLLRDLGPECLSSKESAIRVFSSLSEVTSAELAETVVFMANSSAASPSTSWNIDNFIEALRDVHPAVDWHQVIQKLDYPGFVLFDAKAFAVLFTILRKSIRESPFPSKYFLRKWTNVDGQLSLLKHAVQMPPELLSFASCSDKKATIDIVGYQSKNLKNGTWNSLDLIRLLLEVAGENRLPVVREILDIANRQFPEILVLALFESRTPQLRLTQEYSSAILRKEMTKLGQNAPLLTHLWNVDATLFAHVLIDLYYKDPQILFRVLDLAHELKILGSLLPGRDFRFVLDLAVLSARREFLNLRVFLSKRLAADKDAFAEAIVSYLSDKLLPVTEHEQSPLPKTNVELPAEVILIFLNCLDESSRLLSEPLQVSVVKLKQSLFVHFPLLRASKDSLASSGISGNSEPVAHAATATSTATSPEIEERADALFRKVYSSEISVDDFASKLSQLQKSASALDVQLANCIVHNLLEEYRFFEDYPKNYLNITAQLYGTIILRGLIADSPLSTALNYVVQSLRKNGDSKLFNFGTVALSCFLQRIPEFREFRDQLLLMPALINSDPRLKAALSATHVENSESVDRIRMAEKPTKHDGSADEESVSEDVQNKIHFILNNISQTNFPTKVAELQQVVSNSILYFGRYLVNKRAAAEPNFHSLYISILESMKKKELWDIVLAATLERIKFFLESKKATTADRSTLKNLGSWLGAITLSKNRPILRKQLDLKELICDAFDKGKLISVVPFVAKVLEGCAGSRVFKPHNPFTMGLLSILAEIYRLPDLKLTLRFEVEVLCKHLDVNLAAIPVKSILRDRIPVDRVSSPDFSSQPLPGNVPVVEDSMKKFRMSPSIGPVPAPYSSPQRLPAPSGNQPLSAAASAAAAAPLHQPAVNELSEAVLHNVVVDVQIFHFLQDPQLKSKVASALHKAITDVIGPIVDRSATISCITTRDLVRKDFAFDGDEDRFRACAQLMVQRLTSSLTYVTCRDPLRNTFLGSLRSLLTSVPQSPESEHVVQQLVADNLELGCRIIERAALERCLSDLDKFLEDSYRMRREAHANGVAFVDSGLVESMNAVLRNAPAFPHMLKPGPGTPHVMQLAVYEEFLKSPLRAEESMGMTAPAGPPEGNVGDDGVRVTLKRLHSILEEVEKVVASEMQRSVEPLRTLVSFPRDHPIIVLLKVIPNILSEGSAGQADAALLFAKEVMSKILEEQNLFTMELQFNILEAIRVVLPDLPNALTEWVCSTQVHRIFRRSITFTLLRSGILNVKRMDVLLAHSILSSTEKDPSSLEFAVNLVRNFVIEDKSIRAEDVMNVLDALSSYAASQRAPSGTSDKLVGLVNMARSLVSSDTPSASDAADSAQAGLSGRRLLKPREHDPFLVKLFEEWLVLYSTSLSDQAVIAFLAKVEKLGLLRSPASFGQLFRTCAELAVDASCNRCWTVAQADGTPDNACFLPIDAFSGLLFLIGKWFIKPEMPSAKTPLVKTVVDVFAHVLVEDAGFAGSQFDQRPYVRFFLNVINEVCTEPSLEGIQIPLLLTVAESLELISPLRVPCFAFSWLQLFAHKDLMSRLLRRTPNSSLQGILVMKTLMMSLLRFMYPILSSSQFTVPFRTFYRGVLRVFLVIVHDFPEFLCDFHNAFCDVIPATCVQLQNLVLSAFPSAMRLPDPFTPNLKVDLLPEIQQSPRVLLDPSELLRARAHVFFDRLQEYLQLRHRPSFLHECMDVVSESGADDSFLHALVLFSGMTTIEQLQRKTPSVSIVDSAAMDIFRHLILNSAPRGRYRILNAMANQLRFPNNHTHYFSCVILFLFAEITVDGEHLQEQITRVLFERLIVNRPHPWGLLITFIELVKNPRYAFWQRSFIHCAPEINRLFDNVARSCESASISSSA
eukprot:ANDGO_05250.mRNA.1 General negative regulator of transcription subunit 1